MIILSISTWQSTLFLLNSPSRFVSDTCCGKVYLPLQARLIPKLRRYFADFPNLSFTPTHLSILCQGHLFRFLVRIRRIGCVPFSWALGVDKTSSRSLLFTFSPGSHHCGTPRVYALRPRDSGALSNRKRQKHTLRYHVYLRSPGILT